MGKQQPDKRKRKRISLQILVSYIHNDEKTDNFTYNFSTGGMFIETKHILPIGSSIKVHFESPLRRKSIEVDAVVMWKNEDNHPFGMGVEFKNFSNEKKELLAEMEKDLSEAA